MSDSDWDDFEEDDRLLYEGGPALASTVTPSHELISELMLQQRLLDAMDDASGPATPATTNNGDVSSVSTLQPNASGTMTLSDKQHPRGGTTDSTKDDSHRLPTGAQLHTYDPVIQSYITSSARSTLATYLVPRLQLRNWKRQKQERLENGEERTIVVNPDRLAQVSIFKGWPREASEQICKCMTLKVFEAGEVIVHPREPSREMLFLGFGAVKQSNYLGGKLTAAARRLSAVQAIGNVLPGAVTGNTATNNGVPSPKRGDGSRTSFMSHSKTPMTPSEALANAALTSAVHYAPMSFGELSLLTDEPWSYFLQAHGGRCYTWSLAKSDFTAVLQTVASHHLANTIRIAFQRRNEHMRNSYPMTIAILREHAIFRHVSEACAQAILERLDPCAVPANYLLCSEKEPCNRMLFLRNGVLGLYKARSSLAVPSPTKSAAAAARAAGATTGGTAAAGGGGAMGGSSSSPLAQTDRGGSASDEVLIRAVKPPYILGDADLVHGSSNDTTIRSITHCDAYQLTQASFATVVHNFPRDVDRMLEAARARKQQEVNNNAAYYKAIIQQMPILKDVLSFEDVGVILRLFTPRSYRPMVPVCSVSEYCDRIILLTRGNLRVGGGGDGKSSGSTNSSASPSTVDSGPTILRPGDSIGWTCCVPHRWAKCVGSAGSTVEVLELPQIDLMNYLQREGLLSRVVSLTEALLFPRAGRDGAKVPLSLRPTVDSTGLPPSLRFYPVSRSRVVNYNEPGFCSVHMSLLSMQEQFDLERRKRLGIQTMESFKQLGSDIWVPLSRKVKGFDSTAPEKKQ